MTCSIVLQNTSVNINNKILLLMRILTTHRGCRYFGFDVIRVLRYSSHLKQGRLEGKGFQINIHVSR